MKTLQEFLNEDNTMAGTIAAKVKRGKTEDDTISNISEALKADKSISSVKFKNLINDDDFISDVLQKIK